MKRATRFSLSPTWKVLLKDMGIDVSEVLIRAQLPVDLFSRENTTLTPSQYFDLWEGIEQCAGSAELPLLLAEHLTVESFDAPLFAAICSQNLTAAVKRIQQYKPLIGPMELSISESVEELTLTINCYGFNGDLPQSYSLSELVFFTQVARLCTREKIQPRAITLPEKIIQIDRFEAYFGCDISTHASCSISFSRADAERPFITHNASMWQFFEEKLNRKLSDLNLNATTVERVRAVLLESLPSGESSIEYVASRLAMSKRTLQRKLTAEAETYQSVLQSVRLDLADHYLQKSQMSLGEIAFLLGFQESNSFIRAYSTWKGTPPASYRSTHH